MKIEGMIQLKSGDAVRGIISRRFWWWRFLKVQNAVAVEARTGKSAPADGIVWVPKRNVLFIQQLLKTIDHGDQ